MPPPDSELGQWFSAHVNQEPTLLAWLRRRLKSGTDDDDFVRDLLPLSSH